LDVLVPNKILFHIPPALTFDKSRVGHVKITGLCFKDIPRQEQLLLQLVLVRFMVRVFFKIKKRYAQGIRVLVYLERPIFVVKMIFWWH
jgi:hypothetical protein